MGSKLRIGLSLSGGGARGAYQAGVLKALAEMLASKQRANPFAVISGVSAGAINAAYLASHADDFLSATKQLAGIWESITTDQVFRSDAVSISRIALKMMSDLVVGNFGTHKISKSLLDTSPLRVLLEQLSLEQIDKHIQSGHLEALAITAMDYATACTITFVEGHPNAPSWERLRRQSRKVKMTVDHIMGSAAIPLFFPPIEIEQRFYGDGCLRNTAPLSPAVHLESDKLVIIGVRKVSTIGDLVQPQPRPSVARILSVILNGVMLDAVDTDVERLSKVNETMAMVPLHEQEAINYKRIDYCWIRPSVDIGQLAVRYTNRLPKTMRYLLGGLGSANESSELTSYLLFEPEYCRALIDVGYHDAVAQKDELLSLFTAPAPAARVGS